MRTLVVLMAVTLAGAACANSRLQEAGVETAADVVVEKADEPDEPTEDETEPIVIAPDEPDSEPEPVGDPVATLEPLDADVEHAPGAGAFAGVTGPTVVAVGDLARTNDSGFGEIRYADGSFTRLDAATEFEIVELDPDPTAPTVEARLDIGRTWHRVRDLAGTDGAFVIETAVATASVRGTAFAVVCQVPQTCSFGVAEGIVDVELYTGEIITLTAGEGVVVSTEDDVDPNTPAFDDHQRVVIGDHGLVLDQWVAENAGLDASRGDFGPVPALSSGAADPSGTYAIFESGYDIQQSARIDVDCSIGICTTALSFEGFTLRWERTEAGAWTADVAAERGDGCVAVSTNRFALLEATEQDGRMVADQIGWEIRQTAEPVDGSTASCSATGPETITWVLRRIGD